MVSQSSVIIEGPETRELNFRWWDLASAILLLVAMFTAASRLDATAWTSSLSIIPFLAIIGTIVGIALGQSRFRPVTVFFLGLAYGLFFIGWQIGSTLITTDLPWKDKILSIASRSGVVIHQIVTRQSVSDSIFFIIVMAILFWILSISAGYMLTRYGNAWWAILPAGLAMFTIHTFDARQPRKSIYLAVYVFFGLVLIARLVYLHNQKRWRQTQTAMPPHLGLDFIRFALTAVLVIVMVSWSAPALAQSFPTIKDATQPIRQSWINIRNRWENAFASLKSSNQAYSAYYGDSASLGRGNSLTDTPIAVITIPDRNPTGTRYYWHAMVYNNYNDGTWTNTIYNEQPFDPDTSELKIPEEQGRWQDTFEFVPTTYLKTFYTPAEPFWVSQSSNVELADNPDGTVDIAGFQSTNFVRPQQSYQVKASLNNASIRQLREAGVDYPDWIKERYLERPASITPRTIQLAQRITDGLETPYDKAVAITNYLRDNIEYQETVPPVPDGKEPVDWFLFEYKKGFCNYYATAEVVLLRAVGIPACWAVGYAQGERLEDGRYLVRQRDAHSWPEVYFPGLGWIEFEPTASQSEIVRRTGDPSNNQSNPDIPQSEIDALRRQQRQELGDFQPNPPASTPTSILTSLPKLLLWIGIILIVGVIGFVVWKNRNRISLPPIPIIIEKTFIRAGIRPPGVIRRWAWRAGLPPLSKSYNEINRALIRLNAEPELTQTPAERANLLGNILPPTDEPAHTLVREYQIATFSQEIADYNTASRAGLEIRNLSIKMFIKNIPARIKKVFTRKRNIPDPRLEKFFK